MNYVDWAGMQKENAAQAALGRRERHLKKLKSVSSAYRIAVTRDLKMDLARVQQENYHVQLEREQRAYIQRAIF